MNNNLKKINTDVLNIAYFEAGPLNGPPIFLMHGFPYDIHTHADVVPVLAQQGCRVLSPHLPGFGSAD